MKKTSPSKSVNAEIIRAQMFRDLAFHQVQTRAQFFANFLESNRDLNKDCGYPTTITIEAYKAVWDREGLGTRFVNILPEGSWQSNPEILQDTSDDFTDWEKEVNKLFTKHNLFEKLCRIDKMSGIGRFGILLLGINDGKALDQPVDGVDVVTGEIAEGAKGSGVRRKLLYVRPFDESVTSVNAFEMNEKSPRFGQPLSYSVNLANETGASTGKASGQPELRSLNIHWTRCIHVADNLGNSTVFGVPRMQDIFNRLLDIRKVLGSSAEMFYKGAWPGLAFETQPQTNGIQLADMTASEKKKFRAEIEAYQNGLQRYIALVGMTAKSLPPQVTDPEGHFTTALKAACASKGIPWRIFMGSEEAQLAGAQDKKEWNKTLMKRQESYVVPCLLRPFIDRLMALGVIEYLEEYFTVFPDLNTMGDQEKADIAAKRTTALASYINSGIDSLISPMDYLTHIMGLSTDVAEGILENALLESDGTITRPEPDPEPAAVKPFASSSKKKST